MVKLEETLEAYGMPRDYEHKFEYTRVQQFQAAVARSLAKKKYDQILNFSPDSFVPGSVYIQYEKKTEFGSDPMQIYRRNGGFVFEVSLDKQGKNLEIEVKPDEMKRYVSSALYKKAANNVKKNVISKKSNYVFDIRKCSKAFACIKQLLTPPKEQIFKKTFSECFQDLRDLGVNFVVLLENAEEAMLAAAKEEGEPNYFREWDKKLQECQKYFESLS